MRHDTRHTSSAFEAQQGPRERVARYRIHGVVKTAQFISDQLWTALDSLLADEKTRTTRHAQIAGIITHARGLFEREAELSASLVGPSREAFLWLLYLSERRHFDAHVAALERARTARQVVLASRAFAPETPAVMIRLGPTSSVWRSRCAGRRFMVQCNEGLLHAGQDVWIALLSCALSRTTAKRREMLDAFVESDTYRQVTLAMAKGLPDTGNTGFGRVHDLNAAFDRVNARYFGGQMARPHLRWSPVQSRSTFGTYQAARDQLMVSRCLDSHDVPEFVVDFIVYHELLHKKHGSVHAGGRRCVHTRAFRAEEETFEHFAAAEDALKKLAV
jgi:hypothetical protein